MYVHFCYRKLYRKSNPPHLPGIRFFHTNKASFQIDAVFLTDIWILNPVFHACVMDLPHARTVAFRVGTEIKFVEQYLFSELLPPFAAFSFSFPLHHRSKSPSLDPWRVEIARHTLTDLGPCTSAACQLYQQPWFEHHSMADSNITLV